MKYKLEVIRKLVGDIKENDLNYVDFYVRERFAIFIPSVGYCKYAISKNHIHPSYSFIIYFNNNTLAETNIVPREDEYVLEAISPNYPHQEESREQFSRYIAIFIDKNVYEKEFLNYRDKVDKYDIKAFTATKDILGYVKRFIYEYENEFINKDKVLVSIENIIINELIRASLDKDTNEILFSQNNIVEKTIQYMHQNYSRKISLATLANMCKMSKSSFMKTFKEETSYSPVDYLIKIRIDKSKKLLRDSSKSITEIALECGFSSLSHFSAYFLKKTGMSPKFYLSRYK